MISLNNLLVGPVARLPWRVQTKLLAAFLAIVALLIALGAIGLYELSAVNQRTEELIKLMLSGHGGKLQQARLAQEK